MKLAEERCDQAPASNSDVTPELAAIVAPLAALCAELNFSYSWRVWSIGDRWRAEVAAGFPRVDGRRTGPHPHYGHEAATAAEALERAAGMALEHSRGYPGGYRQPGVPPWMSASAVKKTGGERA